MPYGIDYVTRGYTIMIKQYSGREKRLKLKYKRRKEKRDSKRSSDLQNYCFEWMYDYYKWLDAIRDCKRGTYWKSSVQSYFFSTNINISTSINKLEKGKAPYDVNLRRMVIVERGKARFIEPVLISKRHCEHVFCDNIFVPYIRKSLIYDNGASLSGKGTDFSRRRMLRMLERQIRKSGCNFYIWQFDFKSFFESIKYKTVELLMRHYYDDERIINFIMDSVCEYTLGNIKREKDPVKKSEMQKQFDEGEGYGLCLGSQVSQNIAIIVPNKIDHYIKDVCRMANYIRYMDDGVVLHESKEVLQELYIKCCKICEELGLNFNIKKTHIIKATKGFTFLKTKYHVTKDGKLVRRPASASIKRCRRKLKKFKKKVDQGLMTLDNVFDSFQATYNHLKKIGRSYRSRKELVKLYKLLFGNYKLDRLLKSKSIRSANYELLQSIA